MQILKIFNFTINLCVSEVTRVNSELPDRLDWKSPKTRKIHPQKIPKCQFLKIPKKSPKRQNKITDRIIISGFEFFCNVICLLTSQNKLIFYNLQYHFHFSSSKQKSPNQFGDIPKSPNGLKSPNMTLFGDEIPKLATLSQLFRQSAKCSKNFYFHENSRLYTSF